MPTGLNRRVGYAMWPPGLALVVQLLSGTALGAQWTFAPGVELGATYVDNVALAPSDLEEDDYVYEVNPVLDFAGEGERAGIDFIGRMQNIFYQKDTSDDDTFYQVDGGANVEVVRENLFLDGRITRFQTFVNADGIIPPSNLVVTDNRTNVTTVSAGPRFTGRLGANGSFDAAYRFNRILYSDEGGASGSDTTQHQLLGAITSGDRFRDVTWGLTYDGRRFRRDGDNETDTYQLANLGLDYALSSKLTLLGAFGYEDNDIAETPNQGSGTAWDAGFVWTPNPRTSLGATYGDRFYGNTKSFFLRRATRRVGWEATYREDVTNNAGVETQRPVFDENGDPIFDPSAPGVTNEVFVEKRGDANVQLTTAKTGLGLGGLYIKRDFQTGQGDERLYGGNVIWTLALGNRTRSLVSGEFLIRDLQNQAGEDTFWSTRIGLVRDFTRSIFGSVFYYHADQESDGTINEYSVNAVQVRLTALFGERAQRNLGGVGTTGSGQSVQSNRAPGRTY